MLENKFIISTKFTIDDNSNYCDILVSIKHAMSSLMIESKGCISPTTTIELIVPKPVKRTIFGVGNKWGMSVADWCCGNWPQMVILVDQMNTGNESTIRAFV